MVCSFFFAKYMKRNARFCDNARFYVMSYFTYCSSIWNNCNESDKQKLERLNVRALRYVYNKRVPLHGDDDYGLTLSNRRLQDIAILIFKAVNG